MVGVGFCPPIPLFLQDKWCCGGGISSRTCFDALIVKDTVSVNGDSVMEVANRL